MTVSIVIPNYNGEELLRKNLPSVITAAEDSEIIVVDDASTDGSVTMLKKTFPKIRIVEHNKNLGFSSTVNDGVRIANGELIFLLNSDVLPQENFLKYLTVYFTDPKVFAVGCMQYGIEWKGQIKLGRGIGKFKKGFLIHAPGSLNKKDTLWVFGGAGMYRKKIWEMLEGVNCLYEPFYWEDIDISYRALKAGYTLVFEPRSIVYHEQDKGAIRSNYSTSFIKTIAYRNQIIFVWLNITDVYYLVEHFINLPYHLLKAIVTFDTAFIYGLIQALLMVHKIYYQRQKNKIFAKITDQKVLKIFTSECRF